MRARYWAAIFLGIAVVGCQDTTFRGPVAKYGLKHAAENSPPFDEIDADPNEFSLRMVQAYAARGRGSNQLINTYGLYLSSLAMLNVAEGETYQQLADFLGIKVFDLDPIDAASNQWLNDTKDLDAVKYGTGIFAIRPLRFDELAVRELAHDLGVDTIEFGAAGLTAQRAYQKWVAPFGFKMLPPEAFDIPSGTELMVVTAAKFDADWATKFDAEQTTDSEFRTPSAEKQVKLMNGMKPSIRSWSEHWDGAELRYKGNRFAFSVLLPKDESGAIEDVIAATSPKEWAELISGFRESGQVSFSMPRFEWQGTQSFFEILDDVGLSGLKSDLNLSRLALDMKNGRYNLSGWKQFNAITVGELGTKIESADLSMAAGSETPNRFLVNRPFVYVVRDVRAGLILFVGIVNDPTVAQ